MADRLRGPGGRTPEAGVATGLPNSSHHSLPIYAMRPREAPSRRAIGPAA